MPVDLYVGGAEHAVLHLLYSRFWHKVLYDLGYVSTMEPFRRLVNQGLILGEDGEKMSKSRGNVINPDDVIRSYGADSIRLYEMFMGPLERVKPWSTHGIEGLHRFLQKSWRLFTEQGQMSTRIKPISPDSSTMKFLHKTIARVTDDIENLRFNTAIAALMEFRNHLQALDVLPMNTVEAFVLLLSPFAPHIAEEFWRILGHKCTLAYEPWPLWDPVLIVEEQVTVVVQINGKVRTGLSLPKGTDREATIQMAMSDENVKRFIEKQEIIKTVFVPDKLLNLVIHRV